MKPMKQTSSFFLILLLAVSVRAQTTVNPDVSVVGDIRAFIHNDDGRIEESEKLNLTDAEMELVINGYLNPYLYGNATVAWHEGASAALEELYAAMMRGLPLGMNLKAGKYLLEFGRLNTIHPHAYSFIKRPLVHEHLFGEHGLLDMTIRSSVLLPTGNAYTEIMGGVLKGEVLETHHHEHEEEVVAETGDDDERKELGAFGRLTSSFAVSEYGELALGSSVLRAEYEHGLTAWLFGLDAKYKWKENRNRSFQAEAEFVVRENDQHKSSRLRSYGSYGYIDYRFHRSYNLGLIVDHLREKSYNHEAPEPGAEEETTWRLGLFSGFAPIEETSLIRLAGFWNDPEHEAGFWEVQLQFVFSLGPHQPHSF
ncbi:MAG: hypothetical protein P1R58_02920 [bacterium]|nr:hypothetical protein [bacterium]